MKNKQTIRKRGWKLKKSNIKTKFLEEIEEMVIVDSSNIYGAFKNSILKTCDEKYMKRKTAEETMVINGGGHCTTPKWLKCKRI